MSQAKQWPNWFSGGAFAALLTLAVSGLFKVAAFAREAFIASHFGLSSFTDAYFGFQQLPTLLMSFMFGAFSLAFAPAFSAAKRRSEQVEWLPGLLLYATGIGLFLTLACVACSSLLLKMFTSGVTSDSRATLLLLAFSFCPVIWLGIWTGVTIAAGRNVAAMIVAGLPYFLMTILLIVLYYAGRVTPLSLPGSFLVGFAVVGGYALFSVLRTEWAEVSALGPNLEFRSFIKHLAASSFENLGYSANQLLLIFFLARAGTGAVSANACAMRVGMLGLTLLGQPLAQLVQAKLCAVPPSQQPAVFRRWLTWVAGAVLLFAFALFAAREPVTSLVYLRGKFSSVELKSVLEIVPVWLAYFVVTALNAIAARYLFALQRGGLYVRHQWIAYVGANLVRFAFWGRLDAAQVVWCSVVAELLALLLNLRCCFSHRESEESAPFLKAREMEA